MAAIAADRNLLFGLLALQNGLINQGQLVAAFQAWTLDKARALADHLVGRGDLDADDRSAVDALVARHIKKHGGDVERSLAAIPAGRSTRESLARIDDPDVGGTLAHLGSASTQHGEDADRTASYAVGSATSDGLRFRVLRPHARGGLGAVFVALDTELHREVALKQILDQYADDPVSRQRFSIEAEVTGGLEHPGIVPVYGLGTYGDGRPYYAMRFIRGDSFKEAVERFHTDGALKNDPGGRSLEFRKLLRRFMDVCNAIDYAHSRGVLHRDIKPGNVIVGRYGETLVVDWGLAKPLGRVEPGSDMGERTLVPSSASGSAETLPGSALGTPAYMSPEQACGDLDGLGPRSDVYSLGATLYCLLIGRPPVEGDDIGELLRQVQRGDFARPRQLDPSVDPALEAICLKAMATKPDDRYPSCRALAEDIERWMADEPVSARRESFSERARRWVRRRRTAATAVAAAVLVALLGLASVLVVQARANSELKRSNDDLTVANAKVTRANTELAASTQRERARFALAQEAIRAFHTGVSEDILLKQEEFKALRTKLLRGAREFYRKLEGLLQGHEDRDSRLSLGRVYFEVGELTYELDSNEEAGEVHRRALALFEALAREAPADPEPRREVARGLKALAATLTGVGRHDEALAAYRRACALGEALFRAKSEDPRAGHDLVRDLGNLGILLRDSHRPAEALAAFDRAREVLKALGDANPTFILVPSASAWIDNEGAENLVALGRDDEALQALVRARAAREILIKENPGITRNHEQMIRIHRQVADIHHRAGRMSEALASLERARQVAARLVDAHPDDRDYRLDLVAANADIVDVLASMGKPSEARSSLDEALSIHRKMNAANPSTPWQRSNLASTHRRLGIALRRCGRPAEAASALRQSIAAVRDQSKPNSEDYYNIARAQSLLSGLAAEPGSGLTADEGRAAAEEAMTSLRRAVAAGWRNSALIKVETDLVPIRSRRDFQALVLDMSLPVDPFVRGN